MATQQELEARVRALEDLVDDYVRVGGERKIRHTGDTAIFHEEWRRDESASLHLVRSP